VRVKELYNKLSVEWFSRDEKTAVVNIQGFEAETESLERFSNKENED